jgi:LysM repeat protein
MATTTVKKGDTLSKIAAKAGISLSALLKLNPQIKNPNLIKTGQLITISKPTAAKSVAADAIVQQYTDAATGNEYLKGRYGPGSGLTAPGTVAPDTKANAIIQQYVDAASGDTYLKGRYGPGSGLAAPGTATTPLVPGTNITTPVPAPVTSTTPNASVIPETETSKQPGAAWIWDGKAWVKPNMPGDDKSYTWDDNKGWTLSAPADTKQYTFDVTTGILLFDGKPFTGTRNGFTYKDGVKQEATGDGSGDGTGLVTLEGPTDAALARLDAFAQLEDLFNSYGLKSLAGKIAEYMKAGKGPNETVLLLKKSDEYNLRFQGNTLRLASGLNVMTEAEYLQLEDSYAETLTRYGLRNMLSTDRTKNEAMFAKFMGNDLAAPEFKSRIELATNRVINADPGTKETFKKFFPNITDADLVSYFLSPKDTLDKLQEKATAAEIGGVALSQGLTTSLTSATDLARFGVDRAAAVEGYAAIKEVLPTSEKLGSVYDEAGIKYDQASGEAEFLKLNEDARLKRKRLESLERGSFSGSAGRAANSNKINVAGQI